MSKYVELIAMAKAAGLPPNEIQNLISRADKKEKQNLEREERRQEREFKRQELEREEVAEQRKLEITEAEKQREHEIRLAQLQASRGPGSGSDGNSSDRDLKIPNYNEGKDDIKDYLTRFERIATLRGWEKKNVLCLSRYTPHR